MNGDNEKKSLENRAKTVRLMYTIVNLYVLVMLFCVISGSSSWIALGGTIIFIIPVFTIILWFLNKPCRNVHSIAQRWYLRMSRVILVLGWIPVFVVVLCLGYGVVHYYSNTKKTTAVTQLDGGHELITETAMSQGLIEPTLKTRQIVRWASGHTEKLPHHIPGITNVLEVGGYVFLGAEGGFHYRPGTIASVEGEWRYWSPSQLYKFLRQYVNPNDLDTSAVNLGVSIPHRIESIDPVTLQIVMTSESPIPSMPKHLVFSMARVREHVESPNIIYPSYITWGFDEEATRELLMKEQGESSK